MPETEADRILKAQKNWLEPKEQRKLQKQNELWEKARKKSFVQQMKVEVSEVLRLLKQHSYPDMISLQVWEHSFMPSQPTLKAAWKIGKYWVSVAGYGDSGSYEKSIYLLSDGRIYTDGLHSIGDLNSVQLDSCLSGLRELRRKLEAM